MMVTLDKLVLTSEMCQILVTDEMEVSGQLHARAPLFPWRYSGVYLE
jgi:hypothetical protein